ncbi:MAG: hypothetical protein EPO07_09675 [Verrucomicrobia bacterium]|nr:MAG: hypothetical protein EPO07_09675 [Verrucomicrobiota bacterium]
MRKLFSSLLALISFAAFAAEVIPPAPKLYCNDYADVISISARESLNQRLADFERETSNQILVAIFPKMQSSSSIEDYTVRVAQAWKVGQKDKNNGAVLFVFIQDRKMYLQVGYGLEGALPDAVCKRIIEDEIKPHFKSGDFNGGVTAGVNAILAATKGEYKVTGRTRAEPLILYGNPKNDSGLPTMLIIIFAIILLFIILPLFSRRRGWVYGSGGYSGGWSSGSSWSGGGGSGGGFSGGGGSFGGGGAGGSW